MHTDGKGRRFIQVPVTPKDGGSLIPKTILTVLVKPANFIGLKAGEKKTGHAGHVGCAEHVGCRS